MGNASLFIIIKFIMRNATAGLAVNECNWLLTATLALWCASNTGRLADTEDNFTAASLLQTYGQNLLQAYL